MREGHPGVLIVDLAGHALEVYRDPAPDAEAPFGGGYRELVTLRPGETITPVAAPAAVVAVADLVP